MRLPPQNTDMEQAVLGAIMLERNAFHVANGILTANDFYSDKNKAIYEAFCSLFSKGSPIDLLTVTSELKAVDKLKYVGGALELSQLTERVASAANIEHHSLLVKQEAIKRSAITLCTKIIQDAYDNGDAFELIDELMSGLININTTIQHGKAITLKQAIEQAQKHIAELSQRPDKPIGIPTGFKVLDSTLGGWVDSSFTVVAGRPGMGKTAFVVMTALTAAEQGKRVAFFSLEMGERELAKRVLSHKTQINNNAFKRPSQLTTGQLRDIISVVGTDNLIIDDTAGVSIDRLHSKAKALHIEKPLGLLIVDYIQLMSGKEGNREQQIASIARGLKLIAKDLDIPVIGLSQLSRAVEQRGGDKKPQLSDLRESGAIEQDADNVIFIYRPEYYDIELLEDGTITKGLVELIVAKARDGEIGSIRAHFDGATSTMCDFEDTFDVPIDIEDTPKFKAKLIDEDDVPF